MLTAVILFCFSITATICMERIYYIATVTEEWDYAPHGNLIYSGNANDTDQYVKLDPSIPTPGTKFKKTLYREFKDKSFTERLKNPEWLGFTGPIIKAEIGDTIIIHFQNQAKFPYTIHPHGVFYNKDAEGAKYEDGSPVKFRNDDAVPPGENYTYIWSVRPEHGPKENDPNCISWLYHSHNSPEIGQMTGAVGIWAVCKKGILDENGNRYDVDKEFSLLFGIMDENFSQYRKENIEAQGIAEETIQHNFLSYQIGNMKYAINGYIYGNLPGLDVCLGDKVSIYLGAIGNGLDAHTVYVQGQTMEIYKHTRDTVGIYPGSTVTAKIEAENEGKWLISCQGRDYAKAGMQAFLNVKICDAKKSPKKELFLLTGEAHNHFVAAEEVVWNYAPTGFDGKSGVPLTEVANASFGSSDDRCHSNGTYKKAIYVGYEDDSFTKKLLRSASEEHLGFLGPVIQAQVGDTIKVHFFNRASRPYSMQAFRYFITKDDQGIQYKDGPDVAVQPNEKHIYTWTVPPIVGPKRRDEDCLFGRYYSAVDQLKDTFSGLSGPLLICKKGCKRRKVNRRFYLMFSNVLETESHYWKENVAAACGDVNPDQLAETQYDANTMRSINGFTYGNLPGLGMIEGEEIDWYITSVGNAKGDMHVPHFHGNTFLTDGSRKDTFPLIPDLFKSLEMCPDNPGKWLIEDTIHLSSNEKGMYAFYTVDKAPQTQNATVRKGKTRIYYIAVMEEEWNYYPEITTNPISLEPLDEDPDSKPFYVQGDHRIGHVYTKAVYREFTNEKFTKQKVRTDRELHLGILGPFIKAEVGDKIKVYFKNLAKFSFSIQPHGVFYNKTNEGQSYNDGSNNSGDAVGPGETHIYEWTVPERAGPGKNDFQCTFWPYTSGVNQYSDISAGLLGTIVICRRGTLDRYNTRRDVNTEFALFFNVNDENSSPYIDDNILKYTSKPEETLAMKYFPEFLESNKMSAINGFGYASIRHVDLRLGETAAFYLMSFGDQLQLHTFHWHGNTFIRRLSDQHRHDVMEVLPGDFVQGELLGVNAGNWLVHCHVGNHSKNGMLMTYSVIDPDVNLRPYIDD